MKDRVIGLWVLSSLLLASLTGCLAAVPLLIAGDIALTAMDVNEAMKSVDLKASCDVASRHVWKATLATAEEMDIEVVEKAFNQETGNGILTGKTNKHEKIQILIVADTASVTSIGIKARVREILNMPVSQSDIDISFAKVIIEKIAKHVKKITGEKQEIW